MVFEVTGAGNRKQDRKINKKDEKPEKNKEGDTGSAKFHFLQPCFKLFPQTEHLL